MGECFPQALRLPIHPQQPHFDKIGILLGPANDVWLTCVCATADIGRLTRRLAGQELEPAIQTVKQTAKKVPFWITAVAWSMLAAAFAMFYFCSSKVLSVTGVTHYCGCAA